MAAPREVPIILGVFIALATMMGHLVAARLEQESPRPERPRVTLLALRARAPSQMDILSMVGIGVVSLVSIATQIRARRAWLLSATGEDTVSPTPRMLPTHEREMLARRAGLVFALWACFVALSLWFMLRRPPAERLYFLVPCALLLLPARVYVRYRDGEAMWALWLMGLAAVVLGVTREPKCTWGLLLVAVVCHAS
jgi:hypothetical protein